MSERLDILDTVASQLRAAGLTAHVDGDRIVVGTAHRGDSAPTAVIDLPESEATEYLNDLAATGPRPGETPQEALGYLGTLVLESMISVHDGENNLTDRVFLRRSADGRFGLDEHRVADDAVRAADDSGPLMWTAERPTP